MNRLFLALDGDNAGQHIGQAVLMDDVQMLHDMSQKIDAGTKAVKDMVLSCGGQVISSGGDEMTAMLDPQHESKIEEMRAKYQEVTGFSASIGMGNSLSQAGKALIAAKLTGKNKSIRYDQSVEDILNQAHDAVQQGTADEEQQKMDEHYIDATMENPDQESEQMPMDEEMPADDQMIDETAADENPDMPMDEDSEFYEEDLQPEEDMEDSPEDMMQFPEGLEEDMPEDDIQEDGMVPDGDIPDMGEDMPMDEEMIADEMPMDEQNPEPSEFEQEPPIALEGEPVTDEEGKDPNAEKADPTMATEEDSIEDDLADVDGNEEILQRIAANLDAFKQNKELMDRIKQEKPELYAAMLGLLHNMIELAKMISPEAAPDMEQEEQTIQVPSPNDQQAPAQEEQLPKQNG